MWKLKKFWWWNQGAYKRVDGIKCKPSLVPGVQCSYYYTCRRADDWLLIAQGMRVERKRTENAKIGGIGEALVKCSTFRALWALEMLFLTIMNRNQKLN